MNEPTHFLAPETTCARVEAASRKRVLQQLSECLSDQHPELDCRQVLDALLARERLGSTALGEGVAIPHCRLACETICSAFFTLAEPVDFEAPDSQPVDLVFALIVPEAEEQAHLKQLARLSAVFSEPEAQARFRASETSAELYSAITTLLQQDAA